VRTLVLTLVAAASILVVAPWPRRTDCSPRAGSAAGSTQGRDVRRCPAARHALPRPVRPTPCRTGPAPGLQAAQPSRRDQGQPHRRLPALVPHPLRALVRQHLPANGLRTGVVVGRRGDRLGLRAPRQRTVDHGPVAALVLAPPDDRAPGAARGRGSAARAITLGVPPRDRLGRELRTTLGGR
jgi:hypothetical protein